MFSTLGVGKRLDLNTAIIETLAKKPRLGARELHHQIVHEYSHRVSYQGVHKALNQLELKEVLEKSGVKYALSTDWIVAIKEFLDDVEGAYLHKRPMSVLELPAYGSATVKGDGALIEPYLWVLEQARKVRSAKGRLNTICLQRRTWPLIFFGGMRFKQFKSIFRDEEQFALIHSSSSVDECFANAWKACGFKTKLGTPWIGEVLVCRDFVFQLAHSKKNKKCWDKFYDFLNRTDAEGLMLAHKVAFELLVPYQIVVTHNAEFAEQIRRQTKEHFRSRKSEK